MVDWYYELITHRNLETTYENFILEVTTNMGFPQGGVCSAKLWIIAFDKAAKILNSNGVNGELFADDGNGIIEGKDIEYMYTADDVSAAAEALTGILDCVMDECFPVKTYRVKADNPPG